MTVKQVHRKSALGLLTPSIDATAATGQVVAAIIGNLASYTHA